MSHVQNEVILRACPLRFVGGENCLVLAVLGGTRVIEVLMMRREVADGIGV